MVVDISHWSRLRVVTIVINILESELDEVDLESWLGEEMDG